MTTPWFNYFGDVIPGTEADVGTDEWKHAMRVVEFLLSDLEYRRVAYNEITWTVYVSTVWLGLNHGADNKNPIIFQTMVMAHEDDDCDGWMVRYHTVEQAKAGHEEMVGLVKAHLRKKGRL